MQSGWRGRGPRGAGADWRALMRRTRVGTSGRRGRCRRGACERPRGRCRRGACERPRGRCRRGACERSSWKVQTRRLRAVVVEGADEAPASGGVDEGRGAGAERPSWKGQRRRWCERPPWTRRRGGGSAGHPRGGGREGSSFGGRTGLLAVCGDTKAGPRPQRRPPAPCRPPPHPLLPPRRPAHGAVSGRSHPERGSLPPSLAPAVTSRAAPTRPSPPPTLKTAAAQQISTRPNPSGQGGPGGHTVSSRSGQGDPGEQGCGASEARLSCWHTSTLPRTERSPLFTCRDFPVETGRRLAPGWLPASFR